MRKPEEVLSPIALGAVRAAVAEYGAHWGRGNATINVSLLLEYIDALANQIAEKDGNASGGAS